MRFDPLHPPDQVDAGQNVGPLVVAAELQQAAVPALQLQIVVGLQQEVVELQKAQSGVEPPAVGLEAQHAVHREVAPDLAQEVEVAEFGEPVGVVHDDGALQVDEAADLAPHQLGVARHRLHRQQGAHVVPVGGVADARGAAADQQHRLVAGALQARHRQQADQVTGVQARPRRVDAQVEGNLPLVEEPGQGRGAGGLLDQPAPDQSRKRAAAVPGAAAAAHAAPARRYPRVASCRRAGSSRRATRSWLVESRNRSVTVSSSIVR